MDAFINQCGDYRVSEAYVARTLTVDKDAGTDENGDQVNESLRVRQTKRQLILTHTSGDKVVFTIGRFGKRLTYRDSRTPKRTVDLDYCLGEVKRMLGVTEADGAALLSAFAMTEEARKAAAA